MLVCKLLSSLRTFKLDNYIFKRLVDMETSSFILVSMASSKGHPTELDSLFLNLQSAIKQDKMYWIRNDAKLRAVVTSKNYDEFRNIVDAAHLRPLSREDCKKRAKAGWNRVPL